MWQAIRGPEETATLLEHLGEHLRSAGQTAAADAFFGKAEQLRQMSRQVQDAAFRDHHMTDVVSSDDAGFSRD